MTALSCETYPAWPYSIEYAIANVPTATRVSRFAIAWKPGMQLDFSDLRFRDPATLLRCRYHTESFVAGTSAVFRLDTAAGQSRLEVLYGSGCRESESTTEIYTLYDAFDGVALDPALWTDQGGNTVSGGVDQIDGDAYGTRGISSNATFSAGTTLVVRLLTHPSATGDILVGYDDGTAYAVVLYAAGGETTYTRQSGAAGISSVTIAATAYHTLEIRRLLSRVEYVVDGESLASASTNMPTGSLPVKVVAEYCNGSITAIEFVSLAATPGDSPVFSPVGEDLNIWSAGGPRRSSALFNVPFDWSDFTKQKVISFTVRRSASDAMHRAEVQIEGLVPQGTDYRQVHLLVRDHRDSDETDPTKVRWNRLFYGFLPAQTSRMARAANKTSYVGYSYDFYISAMKVAPVSSVVPSTTNPATWIAGDECVGDVYPTHDVTNVHPPAAWGTDAMPARAFVIPSGASRWQAASQIADELGLVLTGGWLDAGSTPTYTHQDPAMRIIRIEAEDYDAGEGTGYHDTTAANLGGAYRKDGVDIEYFASEGGYNVGWIRDGEWLRYTVAVPVAGNWTAKFRTASEAATGARNFKVYWGTNPASLSLVEDIAVDGTGDYSAFVWNSDEATLSAPTPGTYYLKLLFDNAGDDIADVLHMNIAAIDLYPPPGAGAPEQIVPALYLCDEADIDDPANGLDLPPTAVIEVYDPTLNGEVKYTEDFGAVANAVVIRYHPVSAPDTFESYTVWPHMLSPPQSLNLEGYIDHYEEITTPITAAVAEAYGKALLGYLLESWGTVTANFIKRSDLRYLQTIQFVGHENVPETEFRIVDISYSVALADVRCSITAVPARKFSIEKQLARALKPDPATEIETVAKAVMALARKPMTGTVNTPGASSMTVDLDRGGTITAAGVAATGDRVLCTPADGVGYVATVFKAA